jgi:hypothetical protein
MFELVRALVGLVIFGGTLCEWCICRAEGRAPKAVMIAAGMTLGFFWFLVTSGMSDPTASMYEALGILGLAFVLAFLYERIREKRAVASRYPGADGHRPTGR